MSPHLRYSCPVQGGCIPVIGSQQLVFAYLCLRFPCEINKHICHGIGIKIKKSELLPGLWSPIREKYPEGAKLSIAEILEYTISQSDNVGCDILLKILGGPNFVENYIKASGVDNISIKINEEVMQNNWDRQFENWTTPLAANQILELFFLNESNLLSPSSYDFLWKIMKETATGK